MTSPNAYLAVEIGKCVCACVCVLLLILVLMLGHLVLVGMVAAFTVDPGDVRGAACSSL